MSLVMARAPARSFGKVSRTTLWASAPRWACTLRVSRQADREGYPEIAEAYKRYAWEEAEHASKFAELIGEVVWDTKTNLYKRMNAESGACEDKMRLARMAKEQNLDAVHDTVHEMAKDEARHGKGFEGLYKRYFGK